MSAWTVAISKKLVSDLDSITERLAKRLELAPPRGRAAVEAALQIREFDAFVEAVNNLRKGHTDPTTVLKYRALSHRKSVICVLTLGGWQARSEEHTSELQSPCNLVCRLLL